MKKIKCDCCGRKRKFLESFAVLETGNGVLNFCSECNDLAYKVRDAANDADKKEFTKYKDQWEKREKNCGEIYLNWKKEFLAKNEELLSNQVEG